MRSGNNMKRIISISVILTIIAAFAMGAGLSYINRPAGHGNIEKDFALKGGWGANKVIYELYKKRFIKSRTFFKIMLKLRGDTGNLKRGIYRINNGMTLNEIIDILTSGRTRTVAVTIPEGFNNRQIGLLLAKKGFFGSQKEFLKYASDQSILKKYKIPGKSVEGYLFPDTYYFPIGYDSTKIIEHMVEHFFEKIQKLEALPDNPKKLHDIVILASIVEREAKKKEERPVIAGVFANRLKMNYPLESCATIQYLFKKPKKRIYYQYLKIDSPYNTYINKGLPPGPISNPGLSALKAALNPKKTDYLFFVVRGDGSHYFSKSFGEHARAKKKYIGQ